MPTPCTFSASCTISAAIPAGPIELIGRAVAVRPERGPLLLPTWPRPIARSASMNRRRVLPGGAAAPARLCPGATTIWGWHCRDWAASKKPPTSSVRRCASDLDFGMVQNNLGTSSRYGQDGGSARGLPGGRRPRSRRRRGTRQPRVRPWSIWETLTKGSRTARRPYGCKPDFAAGYNNLGNAYRILNRWADAQAAYASAVRLAPDLPRVHVNRGLAFRGDGKFTAAANCFRRAVDLAPDDVKLWEVLAGAHAADEDYAAAIPCYERLLEFQPERAQWHNELGWALQQEGRHDEAAGCLTRGARASSPDMLDAQLNWGSLHEVLGDLAAAESLLPQAQADHPDVPRAAQLSRHARCAAACPMPTETQSWPGSMIPAWPTRPRTGLLFGLAQVADAQGDYAQAALCLEQANALALEQNRKRGRRYDPVEHDRFVDRLIEAFTPRAIHAAGRHRQ